MQIFSLAFKYFPIEFKLKQKNIPGFIQLTQLGDQLFYWLFPAVNSPNAAPLVIWLTGGPGCSSELAVFYENGPFKINDNLTLSKNPYSWNLNANVLYVDQPVGTSYSTGPDLVTNEEEIGTDFYEFLSGFYSQYTQFKGRALYVIGESYAGHYVPEIASRLYFAGDPRTNLKGIAIGNGRVNPYWQYPAYADFALANQLINQTKYDELTIGFQECQNLIKSNPQLSIVQCEQMREAITGNPPKFNIYDYKIPCVDPPLCYNFSNAQAFLNQSAVIAALGVAKEAFQWTDCNNEVSTLLMDDWMTDMSPKVVQLLNSNVSVLIYSGDLDFVGNWMGGYAWSAHMNWTQATSWNQSGWYNWTVGSSIAGQYKTQNTFTFLVVYNAGHLVPMDQPANALAMLNTFITGRLVMDQEMAQ